MPGELLRFEVELVTSCLVATTEPSAALGGLLHLLQQPQILSAEISTSQRRVIRAAIGLQNRRHATVRHSQQPTHMRTPFDLLGMDSLSALFRSAKESNGPHSSSSTLSTMLHAGNTSTPIFPGHLVLVRHPTSHVQQWALAHISAHQQHAVRLKRRRQHSLSSATATGGGGGAGGGGGGGDALSITHPVNLQAAVYELALSSLQNAPSLIAITHLMDIFPARQWLK